MSAFELLGLEKTMNEINQGLMINIEVQEPLNRQDLAELKRQIRVQLEDAFTIRLDIHYKL